MKQTGRFTTDDICFCGSDCINTKCRRHKSNILRPDIPHSFSDFSNRCGNYKAGKENAHDAANV